MKLVRASIENFKGVGVGKPLVIDFASPSYPDGRPLTCLLGDNGSGKTTVLQAIALTLSLATRQIEDSHGFHWPGFDLMRMSSLGLTRIELRIAFESDELAAVREVLEAYSFSPTAEPPSDFFDVYGIAGLEQIDLLYENGRASCRQGYPAMLQLHGRYYVKRLLETKLSLGFLLGQLGDVFWFDQYRNFGTAENGSVGWRAGVDHLRESLVGMWAFHASEKRSRSKDYIEPLEQRFNQIFPGTRFRGVEPRENVPAPRPSDFYFWLEREGRYYDLAEMSSGEQVIFALVYNFVRLDIARSIVLIDEIELHLHPPEQQALLGMLRKIGPDCQFLITTHSRSVESVIPDDHEVRLEGGRLCL